MKEAGWARHLYQLYIDEQAHEPSRGLVTWPTVFRDHLRLLFETAFATKFKISTANVYVAKWSTTVLWDCYTRSQVDSSQGGYVAGEYAA